MNVYNNNTPIIIDSITINFTDDSNKQHTFSSKTKNGKSSLKFYSAVFLEKLIEQSEQNNIGLHSGIITKKSFGSTTLKVKGKFDPKSMSGQKMSGIIEKLFKNNYIKRTIEISELNKVGEETFTEIAVKFGLTLHKNNAKVHYYHFGNNLKIEPVINK